MESYENETNETSKNLRKQVISEDLNTVLNNLNTNMKDKTFFYKNKVIFIQRISFT